MHRNLARFAGRNDSPPAPCPPMPAVPAKASRLRPVGPILLVVGLAAGRILILRIVRKTTAMTVRPHVGATRLANTTHGRPMNRPWSNARYWLAASLAAALCADARAVAAEPTMAAALQVQGEMVDADAPTAYRLPLIGLCDPADEQAVVQTGALPTACNSRDSPPRSACRNARVPRHFSRADDAALAGRAAWLQPGAARRVLRRPHRVHPSAASRGPGQRRDFRHRANTRQRWPPVCGRSTKPTTSCPQGAQLEGELDVRSVASSHRTPVLREITTRKSCRTKPSRCITASPRSSFARAAVDEQAGSMALYGLGKVYARLAERRDDDVQCTRGAMTMYCGRARRLPEQSTWRRTSWACCCAAQAIRPRRSTTLRGRSTSPRARPRTTTWPSRSRSSACRPSRPANEQESQRLAAWERSTGAVSRRAGVQWVSPAEMARVTQPAPLDPGNDRIRSTAAKPTTHHVNHDWR